MNITTIEEFGDIVEEMVSHNLLIKNNSGEYALSDKLRKQLIYDIGDDKINMSDLAVNSKNRNRMDRLIIRSILKQTYPRVQDSKQVLDYYNVVNAYLYSAMSRKTKLSNKEKDLVKDWMEESK